MIVNTKKQTDLTVSDFRFDLPTELIAQEPYKKRDEARLLLCNREKESIDHAVFKDIVEHLREGDVLVLNDSRVIPARLYGINEQKGSSVEIVLLRQRANDLWEAIAGPGKRARLGNTIVFGEGLLRAEVIEVKKKPTHPVGRIFVDCFGDTPEYEDRGIRLRALLGMGKLDYALQDALMPRLAGAFLVGDSSDHAILDVEDCAGDEKMPPVKVGDILTFDLKYSAVLYLSACRYINVEYVD